jgi:hypothetical protein
VTVRDELGTIESALQGLRVELAAIQSAEWPAPPSVSRAWIQARVDQLVTLVAEDPARARTEIRKAFEGISSWCRCRQRGRVGGLSCAGA